MRNQILSVFTCVTFAILLVCLPSCQQAAKDEYDITGTWNVKFNWKWEEITRNMTFNGSTSNGSFTDVFSDTGTYSINGKSVSWTYSGFSTTYTGSFSSTTAMSGTMNQTFESRDISGTWTATKSASASTLENILYSADPEGVPMSLSAMLPSSLSLARSLPADEYFRTESFPEPYMTGNVNTVIPIDFDMDGDLDVVLMENLYTSGPDPYGRGRIFAMRNDGQGYFADVTGSVLNGDTQTSASQGLVADFSGDGRPDLFLADGGLDKNPWPGDQNMLFIQSPDGRLVNETSSRLPAISDFTHDVATADVDGDGDLDIYVCNVHSQNEKYPYLLINDGHGFFTKNTDRLPGFIRSGSAAHFKKFTASHFEDVDKDGDADLILGSHPAPKNDSIWSERDMVFINDGSGHFSYGTLACAGEAFTPLRITWTTGGDCAPGAMGICSADFDNDGWPDLAVTTTDYAGDAKIQLLVNNQNGTFHDASSGISQDFKRWTDGPRAIGAFDFNQDGLMDIYTNGRYGPFIFLNKGNYTFLMVRDALGLPSWQWWKGWPADYDKDGDIDLFGLDITDKESFYFFRNMKPYVVK